MIDKIKFHKYIDNPESLLNNFKVTGGKSDIYTDSKTYYGKLENLRIKISGHFITIEGSFPKYYNGNNLIPLNETDTKLTIEKISDSLKINIDDFYLSEIEFGINLIMDNPVIDYLLKLIYLNRFTYSDIKGSIYFEKGDLKLCFYDKINEHIKKKNKLPNELINKNLLRYEMRYKREKEIKKHFQNGLVIKDLTSKQVNNKMIELLTNYYFQIEKNKKINREEKEVEKFNRIESKNYNEKCVIYTVKSIGIDKLLKSLESDNHKLSPVQYCRLKKRIISANQNIELPEKNVIKELDKKIIEARTMFYS